MKTYTKQEALTMFRNNQTLYAELAHQYPCCNLPIAENCNKCTKQKECITMVEGWQKRRTL